MNFLKTLALISTLSTLIGCSHATLDREDCVRGNWAELGVQDGLAGKTLGELNLHKAACSEYAIIPNEKLYKEGREKGLKDYCKIDNAVTSGLSGHLYQSVCPKEIDESFRKQNLAAYNLYSSYMRNSYYNNYYGGYGYGYYGYPYYGYPYGMGSGYYGGFRPFFGFGFRHR